MQKSTMAITKETKEQLDKLKVHPREPYEDVIKRLLERCK
jgi:predicted CopG family antitoxin